jgi:broad specificity phosphatase PhoE
MYLYLGVVDSDGRLGFDNLFHTGVYFHGSIGLSWGHCVLIRLFRLISFPFSLQSNYLSFDLEALDRQPDSLGRDAAPFKNKRTLVRFFLTPPLHDRNELRGGFLEMSEIYLIRHAQASFGDEDYDHLSDLGIRQARILGDYFALLGMEFQAFYSGEMERQTDTAEKVMPLLQKDYEESELHVTSEFNECSSRAIIRAQISDMMREDPSVSEDWNRFYTNMRSFQRIFERAMLRWISGGCDIPGIETWQAFTKRVRAGLRNIMEVNGRKKRVAVFTSAGPISAVMQMALGLSDEETIRLSYQIRNTSVSVFKYGDNKFSLSSFNSVAHLEYRNEEGLITYR